MTICFFLHKIKTKTTCLFIPPSSIHNKYKSKSLNSLKRPWTYLLFKSIHIFKKWTNFFLFILKSIYHLGFFFCIVYTLPSFNNILYSIIHFNDYAFFFFSSLNWIVMMQSSFSLRIHAFDHNGTASCMTLYYLDMFLGIELDFSSSIVISYIVSREIVWVEYWDLYQFRLMYLLLMMNIRMNDMWFLFYLF
jgi:hypothetical protein